jgi:hypothetical protein
MAFSGHLPNASVKDWPEKRPLEEKKLFGRDRLPVNGNMLVGVWEESRIVRLSWTLPFLGKAKRISIIWLGEI